MHKYAVVRGRKTSRAIGFSLREGGRQIVKVIMFAQKKSRL